jgi:hypothetical protein
VRYLPCIEGIRENGRIRAGPLRHGRGRRYFILPATESARDTVLDLPEKQKQEHSLLKLSDCFLH